MDLIIHLLVVAIVVVLAFYVLDRSRIPDPINLILRIVVAVVALLYLLGVLGLRVP